MPFKLFHGASPRRLNCKVEVAVAGRSPEYQCTFISQHRHALKIHRTQNPKKAFSILKKQRVLRLY